MSRYVFRFNKINNMRFISHLDIQRLFKRSLRRSDIELLYSQGYNPHPKINLVQPLSLGFETNSDYFEIETASEENLEEMLNNINLGLPSGIKFLEGKALPPSKANLSAIVEFAKYRIFLPLSNPDISSRKLNQFASEDIINIDKIDKKTKKPILKDVKHMIKSIELLSVLSNGIIIDMILHSASNDSLNPLYVLESFCKYSDEIYQKERCRVCREDLYIQKGNELISLFDYDFS